MLIFNWFMLIFVFKIQFHMKLFNSLFIVIILCFSQCKESQKEKVTTEQETKTSIKISGYFENIGDLTKVTLNDFSGQQHKIIAETLVKNNSFEFSIPKPKQVTILTLGVNGIEGYVPIIAQHNDLVLRMNLTRIYLSDVSGDNANDAFSFYKKEKYKYDNQIASINELSNVPNATDEMKDTWQKRIAEFKIATKETYLKMFNDNLNNFTSGLILEDLFREQIVSANEGLNMFEKLPEVYKETNGAKSVYQYMLRKSQGL